MIRNDPALYQAKPVVVVACQTRHDVICTVRGGVLDVPAGHWIVSGPHGDRHVYSPEEFAAH